MNSCALEKQDIPQIVSLLSRSLSPVAEVQKECERALKDLEPRDNFLSCLVEILGQRDSIEYSCRWLASVYLKNVISRSWRSRLGGAISQEEKQRVKEGLFGFLCDPDNQIAIQIAIALSKIGRVEYPKEWPQLFDMLLLRLQGDNELVLKRTYMALYLLLKELSSKRLAIDQKNFDELCAGLYGRVMTHWVKDVEACVAMIPQISVSGTDDAFHDTLLMTLERIILQIKCVKRILVFGFPSDAASLEMSDGIRESSPFIVQTMSSWLDAGDICLRMNFPRLFDGFGNALLKFLKLLEGIQEKHCWAFAASGSLIPYLELICSEIMSPRFGTFESVSYMKEVLKALYAVIKCPGYKGSSSSLVMTAGKAREQKSLLERMASDVSPLLATFWSNARDANIISLVVTRYFVLTRDELLTWETDGEGFHQDMEHAAKEETLRGRAEMLFNALLESNRKELSFVLISMMQQCNLESPDNRAQATISATSQGALQTAAVLHALALGAYELYDHVNFTEMLHGSILPILSPGSTMAAPLRRESLKLISYWVTKLKPHDRPSVYSILLSILQEKDSAMFLMSCSTLQALMEDWEFDVEQFRPFAMDAVQLLISILSNVSEYESQLEVFSVLNLVIDHLQEKTIECAPMILNMIPALWDSSEGQSLLRIQIMLALQRLVHALGSESPITYPVVLPILNRVIDSNNSDPANIVEDGIYLWIVVLRHVPGQHQDVVSPLTSMLQIMQQSSEYVLTGTRCISSTILLYGDELLEGYGIEINKVLCQYIGTVKDKAMVDVIACVDTIVQACPRYGVQCMAGSFSALLILIQQEKTGNVVISPFIIVLCRVALQSPDQIVQLFQYTCHMHEQQVVEILNRKLNSHQIYQDALPYERLLACFLDLWTDKFDGIGQTGMRKMAALGLSSFLTMKIPSVVHRCGEIVSHILSVWFELEGPEAEIDPISLSFPIAGMGPKDDFIPVSVDLEEAEGEPSRRQALFKKSPITEFNIGKHFRCCMLQALQIHGEGLQMSIQAMNVQEKEMFDKVMNE